MNNMDFICGFSNATVFDKASMYTDITLIICITIVVLALIAAGTILILRKRDAKVKSEAEARQRAWDVEDRKNKTDAETLRRNLDEEDKNKKLEAEIKNKRLAFLEEQIKVNTTLKALSSEECKAYVDFLDKLTNPKTDQKPNE